MNNNIQDQLVSFEVAKLLKEKGFDIQTEYRFFFNSDLVTNLPYTGREVLYYAPTQSLAVEWIRLNFGLHIKMSCDIDGHYFPAIKCCTETAWDNDTLRTMDYHYQQSVKGNLFFQSPQEAIEATLLYILKQL
jgi:hypothetical protein